MDEPSPQLYWSELAQHLAQVLPSLASGCDIAFVGGTVRDAFLGRASKDIDIAVDGDAIALARRAADALPAALYIMDRERGVARLFLEWQGQQHRVDIACYRGASLALDLADRDFRINAMAVELGGSLSQLIDPLGGADDLRRRVLRRCAPHALQADPVRILRALRLCVQFGLRLHPNTAADLRANVAGLEQVSGERLRDELFHILGLEDAASRALRVLEQVGAMPYMPWAGGSDAPGETSERRIRRAQTMGSILKCISARRGDNTAASFHLGMLVIQLDRFRAELQAHLEQRYADGRSQAQLLMLGSWLRAAAAGAQSPAGRAAAAASALKLSQPEARRLRHMLADALPMDASPRSDLQLHRFWVTRASGGIDSILLAAADALSAPTAPLQEQWLALVGAWTAMLDAYFRRHSELVQPPPLLNGRDIMRLLNIAAGPRVGQLLHELREAQVKGIVKTDSDARTFVLQRN